MRTVVLGKTDLEVSRIGMGSIPLNRPTEDEAISVLMIVAGLFFSSEPVGFVLISGTFD